VLDSSKLGAAGTISQALDLKTKKKARPESLALSIRTILIYGQPLLAKDEL
jgi:hypothetical protein